MDRSGSVWRLAAGSALAVLCLLQILPLTDASDERAGEWAPVVLFFLAPPAIALFLSAVGLQRGWRPVLPLRLLPIIVCACLLAASALLSWM